MSRYSPTPISKQNINCYMRKSLKEFSRAQYHHLYGGGKACTEPCWDGVLRNALKRDLCGVEGLSVFQRHMVGEVWSFWKNLVLSGRGFSGIVNSCLRYFFDDKVARDGRERVFRGKEQSYRKEIADILKKDHTSKGWDEEITRLVEVAVAFRQTVFFYTVDSQKQFPVNMTKMLRANRTRRERAEAKNPFLKFYDSNYIS